MKYTAFHASQFQAHVQKALESVERILDVERHPRLAEDVDHQYDDKYALAEFLTNTTIAAEMNIFERMGLSEGKLSHLYNVVKADKRTVTICFQAEDSCTFQKEQVVDVVSHNAEYATETTKKSSGMFGGSSTQSKSVQHKVIKKVHEFHWKVSASYRIFFYAGNDPDKDAVDLLSRTSSTTIVTTGSKKQPFPPRTIHDAITANFTWLLQNIKESEKQRVCAFKIDRSKDSCRTPRRNDDVEASIAFFQSLSEWFTRVRQHFINRIEGQLLGAHRPANPAVQTATVPSLSTISQSELFCPVVPLLEPSQESAGTATRQELPKSLLVLPSPSGDESRPLLSLGDIDKLLNEQCRTLDETMASLTAIFPSHQLMKLVTVAEASLVCFSGASNDLYKHYQQSIEYIEKMLHKQMIAAIGKEVGPKEFHQFMQFHCGKLLSPNFAPRPFSHAIRRPNHYPDGILSIEANDGDKAEPINTHVRHLSGEEAPAVSIPINAATNIEMTGDRFLHGWINHRFASSPTGSFTLSARARQFSSFMLIIGVMAGADKFSPKDAIIVQNKDEVLIPLLLNELPSAKDFKDSIASLSPEQQRFATAFRGMQLESSVFGVCVIQLKPQLEALLGLPAGSLTKEIRLTQDLMSLFIDYQIPSDLVSFDGPLDASVGDKVGCVKAHAQAVLDVISEAKKSEVQEMEMRAAHNVHELRANSNAMALNSRSYGDGFVAGCGPSMVTAQGGRPASGGFGAPPTFLAAPPPGGGAPMMMQKPIQQLRSSSRRRAPAPAPQQIQAARAPPSNSNTTSSMEDTAVVPSGSRGFESKSGVDDFTMIPKQLDSLFELHDTDNGIRATILKTDRPWKRNRQENLLSKLKESKLNEDECKSEKNKAFDLLDALSRSGALPISFAELHVVVAVTHCFENDVMGTVVQDNINPIEKVEKSILMVASTIQGESPQNLIADGPHLQRLTSSFPGLIQNDSQVES